MRRFFLFMLASTALALPGSAAADAASSPNISFTKNLSYEARNGGGANQGSDLEFARIAGRQYALAGSYDNGMQIVDVSDPRRARIAGVYDCGVTQGDVEVFRQADKPGRTFAAYTSDESGDGTSTCYREAAALGFATKDGEEGKHGTFIVDVTNPARPRTVSFVEIEQGSHNQSVHPSGRYLYNSNADLITSFKPAIEIYDIASFTAPRKTGELELPTRPGLGTESHDITFDRSGRRAYSAALSQGALIDSSRPAQPRLLKSFLDPAINVWHQADPIDVRGRDGKLRRFLIVEDEFAGAAGGPVCPSGGFHVYDVTGDRELNPKKVGYWNIDEVRPTTGADQTCTAHVFDIHEREKKLTVAYYNGGVRVVDLSGLAGLDSNTGTGPAGAPGMREVGFFRHENADTWAAKTPSIEPDGSFWLYGNDIARGFDVYRYDAKAPRSPSGGTWLPGTTVAPVRAPAVTTSTGRRDEPLFCLFPG